MKRQNIEFLLIDYEIKSLRVKKVFELVMQKIPDSYKEEFPCFSVWEGTGGVAMEAYVDGQNIYFNADLLLGESEDIQAGIIAHELAHICLRHYCGVGSLKDEDKADKLACQWGFVKEIKAMRGKFGPLSY